MKISLQWLSEWAEVGSDVAVLSHALTMAGLEIEGQASAAPNMSGVVVAEVLATTRHPDAERLSVCRVNDGQQQLQIVCGASNVRAGIKVPLATVGAVLPGGKHIGQAKPRGVDSFGMLCSASELGLAEASSGLLELPADLQVGENLISALHLDDTILEINLTPNRGDCMSVLGVAREVAAQRNHALQLPPITPIAAVHADTFPVRIESAVACPTFVSRIVKGLHPAARSPWWLSERLRRAGVRSVSAIVDVTNYVMLELGQPMHAYDLQKLTGGLSIRQATTGEQLTLLDAQAIVLSADVLVIADSAKPLALAGVMGGVDSAISDATIDVLLEVAHFAPDAIAGRGRRYGLVTDASQRFERGVDPELPLRAMERATQLLLQCVGGSAGPVQVTGNQHANARAAIELRHARITRVLGLEINEHQVTQILYALGMIAEYQQGSWRVTPPSWRFDINIEEDLIEEVARLYGYENIPSVAAAIPQVLQPITESKIPAQRCAMQLVDRGYQEAITYSFTDPAIQSVLFPKQASLALSNPISSELGTMRLSLWPGLVEALVANQRRQQPRVRLFEIGRKFSSDGKTETLVIAGLAAGMQLPKQWGAAANSIDFYDVKADVESLLALTGRPDEFTFAAAQHPALHPGQTARVLRGQTPVGWLGALHPLASRSLELVYPAMVFELELEPSFMAHVPEYKEFSRLPVVRRDLALIVDQAVIYSDIEKVVRAAADHSLTGLTIFDVYQGNGLEKGKKSMALGLSLQDTSHTLTDAEIDQIVARVVDQLGQRLDARLRDK